MSRREMGARPRWYYPNLHGDNITTTLATGVVTGDVSVYDPGLATASRASVAAECQPQTAIAAATTNQPT